MRYVHLLSSDERLPFWSRAQVVVGDGLARVGWGVLLATAFAVWAFGGSSELVTDYEFASATAHTTGRVVDIRKARKGAQREIAYRYQVGAADHQGVSFSPAGPPPFQTDDTVRVEYLVGRPHRSRIAAAGVQARPMSGDFAMRILLPGLLAAAGIALVVGGFIGGRRTVDRLRRAQLGYGRIVGTKIAHRSKSGRRTTFEVILECVDASAAEASAVTWQGTATVRDEGLAEVRDEAHEPILYDPEQRERVTLIDALDGGLRLDQSGRIVIGRSRYLWMGVLLPVAFVALNVAAALLLLASLR